ncbi:MAG: hypothetical protein ACFFAJ_01640 [Candidatus Hodarchaeota archaeon]
MRQDTDYKWFNFLKLSILGFGIITLPEIIVMLFKIVIYLFPDTVIELGFLSSEDFEALSETLSALQYIFFLILLLSFLILALGVYLFSSSHEEQIGKEGKRIALYLLLFFGFMLIISLYGSIHTLMMGDYQMTLSLTKINDAYYRINGYPDKARNWSILVIIVNFLLFPLLLKFSIWLNEVTKQYSPRCITALTITSGFYFFASFFVFISIMILFPPIGYSLLYTAQIQNLDLTSASVIMESIPLRDVVEAQFTSFFLYFLGFIFQFIISILIVLKLRKFS